MIGKYTLPAQMVDRNHDGITYIALNTPVGLTLEETANELSNQVLHHVNAFCLFQNMNSETNTPCMEVDGQ